MLILICISNSKKSYSQKGHFIADKLPCPSVLARMQHTIQYNLHLIYHCWWCLLLHVIWHNVSFRQYLLTWKNPIKCRFNKIFIDSIKQWLRGYWQPCRHEDNTKKEQSMCSYRFPRSLFFYTLLLCSLWNQIDNDNIK